MTTARTVEIAPGLTMIIEPWTEQRRKAHYESFEVVTFRLVQVGDWDELAWIALEPSEIFCGLGVDRYFHAGSDEHGPDPEVVWELRSRGVTVVIEHDFRYDLACSD